MKKIKNFFTKNIKIFLAFVLGILVSFGVVYAATVIGAGEVSYTPPSGSGISSTNVQDAIDDLYTKATPDNMLTSKVLANKRGLCIYRKGRLHCFKINNWAVEKDHIQQVFSDISCSVTSSSVLCNASDVACSVRSNGDVSCYDHSDNSYCGVNSDGSVGCS